MAVHLDYLDHLEAESIYILRETFAQFKNPVLLFSGGKDSITVLRLAQKAFYPGKLPFPILHIDTGSNFPEVIKFRDDLVKQEGLQLIVRYVSDSIKNHNLPKPTGKLASRNALQTYTLLDSIKEFCFDACIGGARRDEEKARAKERIFSVRDKEGHWKPDLQRPELWDLYNGRINPCENVRVFPISNWTELDVWNYINRESIKLPSIYFSHERECLVYDDRLVAISPSIKIDASDIIINKKVRFRTVGDMNCTAAVESKAITVDEIIAELKESVFSERGETRLDDKTSSTAMEDRKTGGYF